MSWNKFDASKIQGTLAPGDVRTWRTRWWLLPILIHFVWKMRAVFTVSGVDVPRGYRIGYKPFKGPARLNDAVIRDRVFQVRIGHEDCTFFAVSPDGHEVPLRLEQLVVIGKGVKLPDYIPLI